MPSTPVAISVGGCLPLWGEGHHHECSDDLDLIEGQPTGCVHISFGFTSTMSDIINVIEFIENYFVQDREKIDVKSQYHELTQKTEVLNVQINNLTSASADSELWKVQDTHWDASQGSKKDNLRFFC